MAICSFYTREFFYIFRAWPPDKHGNCENFHLNIFHEITCLCKCRAFRKGLAFAFKKQLSWKVSLPCLHFVGIKSLLTWLGADFPLDNTEALFQFRRKALLNSLWKNWSKSKVDMTWISSQNVSSKFSFANVDAKYAAATLWKFNNSPKSRPTFYVCIWHPGMFDSSTESQRGDILLSLIDDMPYLTALIANTQWDIAVVFHYSAFREHILYQALPRTLACLW